MVKGYQKTQRENVNKMLYLAWHIAVFERAQKLPDLKSILQDVNNEPQSRKEQTDEEIMEMCKLLNAAFGGKVVEK